MSRKSNESSRFSWHRALSIRSSKSTRSTSGNANTSPTSTSHNRSTKSSGGGKGFSLSSLRGSIQPELSKRLYRLIKSENNLISSYEAAGKERLSIATQLSEWGEHTNDEAISDISDKVGVILSEIGEQEDNYAHALDESRAVLKTIRNTEKSVQPSRDGRNKLVDEIGKLKSKEPESARLVVLEQELVRAEAENMVAEAQLRNITRQKLKEAYQAEFLATIERAEKQVILAKHGLRLLELLDDTPIVPGDAEPNYGQSGQARQILNDAEDDLRDWRLDLDGVLGGTGGDGLKKSETPPRGEEEKEPEKVVQDENASPVATTGQQQEQQTLAPTMSGGNGGLNMQKVASVGV
ncbi:Eisosome component PIL1 domain containing protein [Rhypophila sp. PSN 637]